MIIVIIMIIIVILILFFFLLLFALLLVPILLSLLARAARPLVGALVDRMVKFDPRELGADEAGCNVI